MPFRPRLWPTLFTIPVIILCLGLGTWQVQRLAWKNSILERIDQRLAEPAVPLPAKIENPDEWEYRRVSISGVMDHSKEIHKFALSPNANQGYQVVVPMTRSDGHGTVLINRGWVPVDRKDPASRTEGLVKGEQAVSGIIRIGFEKQSRFAFDNDENKNVWFHFDLPHMQRVMGVTAPMIMVEADDKPNPGLFPLGGQTRINIPNSHLQYAFTWYSMAVILLVIYIVWHIQQDRKNRRREDV